MNLVNVLAGDIPCGDIMVPGAISQLIRSGIFIIQVVVPILLILWGMLDFAKGVMGSDEDKIKEGQKKFIQRLIAAVIVFLVVVIVQLVITTVGSVAGDDAGNAWSCASRLISGNGSAQANTQTNNPGGSSTRWAQTR